MTEYQTDLLFIIFTEGLRWSAFLVGLALGFFAGSPRR